MRRSSSRSKGDLPEIRGLVRKKRDGHGCWPLENPLSGPVHFEMEGRAGGPSR